MKIIKRNKELQDFDFGKIKKAILSAYMACNLVLDNETIIDDIYAKISDLFKTNDVISVEQIQDIVESVLMKEAPFEVAHSYTVYREKHNELRVIEERINYIENYTNSSGSAATASETDPNANVIKKTVATMEAEVWKSENRKIQRRFMKKKLKEMYPEVADQYEKDLESHIIYTHDEASTPVKKNYCEAISLYPLMLEGCGNIDGVTPGPPQHYISFCGQLVNLTHALAGQCKGAVAIGELFNFLDYYCAKDFGSEYHKNFNELASIHPRLTILDCIHQGYQQLVCGWNQPAGIRGGQSPFVNISYYDSNYWKALFDEFLFPDGTKPVWDRVNFLQKDFMIWFNNERLKSIYTFPVESVSLLTDGKDVIDKEWKDFTAEMWAKGHSFFCYQSKNPNALASCCFSKDQKVLWKSSTKGINLTTLEELHNLKWEPDKKNLTIFHNGSWVKGKSIKLPNRPMYKVTTWNNKEFYMTDNHINVTSKGEKLTSELTPNDYLLFNTMAVQAIPERDENLTYDEGVLIGAFVGDGSMRVSNNGICECTVYSINANKYKELQPSLEKVKNKYNLTYTCSIPVNNCISLNVTSKSFSDFIVKWTDWKPHTTAYTKELNLNVLSQSLDFRKGILDGWYLTDGENSNRCYTVSPSIRDAMEVLITSLGMQSIIDVSDRTDEAVIIRGEEFKRNYLLFCVRFYSPSNVRSNKDENKSWIKRNNSIYFRIKSIEKVDYTDNVYCIECKNEDEPYFTLPSGLITHNCRLRNEIQENEFSFTNGLTGVMTGSVNVITLNLNRIIQDWARSLGYTIENSSSLGDKLVSSGEVRDSFVKYLTDILSRVYKYHKAYKTMIYETEEAGLLTASTAGYIHMNKLFSTIGINGHNEAAEFLGYKCTYNDKYRDFIRLVTGTISQENRANSSKRFKFNTECVPAEGLSSKNYKWDKNDNYWVPETRNLYNSYFYLADDPNTSVLDRFRLHGEEFTGLLDGGVGLHCNLEEHLSKEQYKKLIDFAIACGTSYWTFNIPNSQCDDCGYITKVPIKECPKCHSKNITLWTRVIGFIKAISSFDFERYKEALRRIYSKSNEVQC